jgi:hypothetical protein
MKRDHDIRDGLAALALVAVALPGGFAAWLTHVIVCLSSGSWGFLVAGALMWPIGIIHGVGLWFGIFR